MGKMYEKDGHLWEEGFLLDRDLGEVKPSMGNWLGSSGKSFEAHDGDLLCGAHHTITRENGKTIVQTQKPMEPKTTVIERDSFSTHGQRSHEVKQRPCNGLRTGYQHGGFYYDPTEFDSSSSVSSAGNSRPATSAKSQPAVQAKKTEEPQKGGSLLGTVLKVGLGLIILGAIFGNHDDTSGK